MNSLHRRLRNPALTDYAKRLDDGWRTFVPNNIGICLLGFLRVLPGVVGRGSGGSALKRGGRGWGWGLEPQRRREHRERMGWGNRDPGRRGARRLKRGLRLNEVPDPDGTGQADRDRLACADSDA